MLRTFKKERRMHIVKSVGVLSVARILGMVHACLGLLFAPFFLLFGLIGSLAGRDRTPFAGVFGVFFALFMPVIYGVMGFIVGAIGAFLYNIFSKWVGGFEVELDVASVAPAAPPVAPYPLVPPITPNV
jgi:hypothetical protein